MSARVFPEVHSAEENQHAFIPSKSGIGIIHGHLCVTCRAPLARTRQSTTTTSSHKGHARRRPLTRSHRGQQAIEPARVTEIQQALIREHYLTGEANGQWDATTVAAMQKYQADQGWQTKLMPDSRALKKLGLGPDYSTRSTPKDRPSLIRRRPARFLRRRQQDSRLRQALANE